jgi:methionine-rich copper-binding protein CopC
MRAVVFRNLYVVATTSIVALIVSIGLASPALAHESISEQNPIAGQTVSAGSTDIRLVFTGDLLVLSDASGIELQITDPRGTATRLAERGCLIIGSRSVESTIELDLAGEYRVDWQVTAGDGHPLSESFTFRVENASGFVANQALSDIRCEGNRLPDGSVAAPASESGQPSMSTNTWLAILLGLALALVSALLYLTLRPGRNRANSN